MRALDARLVRQLYMLAGAARWNLTTSVFHDALSASLERAFTDQVPGPREVDRYLRGLHLADLALACACVEGNDDAWEHLIREYRPALYRAADAMDPTGRARELADALYADLFATAGQRGERRSLLRYFHGRSSLATWLRSVLAQRHVDTVRVARRFDPLPDSETAPQVPGPSSSDPDRERCQALVEGALAAAISQLAARDRLRLGCYYAQQLTLAETGRVLHEHEATVSRQLARTRREIRQTMERWLEEEAGLRRDEVLECLHVALEDSGPLDIGRMLAAAGKIADEDRSKRERP